MPSSFANKAFKMIQEQEIKLIDFRFTDILGRWHHITKSTANLKEEALEEVITFDGSSLKGWKQAENSDMFLMPDYTTFFIDPFSSQNMAAVVCDVYDPDTGKQYSKCPRGIARKAEDFFASSGVGDSAFFGPEPEFFVFDSVRSRVSPFETGFSIVSSESCEDSFKETEGGNMAHRPGKKGGYVPVQPVDHLADIRGEMLTVMNEIGLDAYLHHHEVAPGQCELGFKFGTLTQTADNTMKYKYVVRNVAQSFGKTATFMPKPIFGDNGSGMHVHQSIWKGGKNLFAGKEKDYAALSDTALYYIGGIIKHAPTLTAFANPTVNSYKRLVPGFEAPTLIAYSAKNRSAFIRIPYSQGDGAKRIEVRFPDPSANPYLLFAGLLLAGLDGIKNKIHPGSPKDQNLYKERDSSVESLPSSLQESLENLDKNREFLKAGGVFSDEFIDSYIALKREEVREVGTMPHPAEFKLYYSC